MSFAGSITVFASNIPCSGISPYAELIYVPTFAPPIQLELYVYEDNRNLMNFILTSAKCTFSASDVSKDQAIVRVQDETGVHDVAITRLDSSNFVQQIPYPDPIIPLKVQLLSNMLNGEIDKFSADETNSTVMDRVPKEYIAKLKSDLEKLLKSTMCRDCVFPM